MPLPRRPFALFVLAAAGVLAAVIGLTASAGVYDNMAIAAAVAIVAAVATSVALARHSRFASLVAQPPAIARTLFVVGSITLAVQLAWLTVFIIDPSQMTWIPGPVRPMPPVHSCVVPGRLQRGQDHARRLRRRAVQPAANRSDGHAKGPQARTIQHRQLRARRRSCSSRGRSAS